MSRHLASLLDREQDRIALTWASALSRLRPSAYVFRPLEELRRLGRSYLSELVLYLDTDDPSGLREFIRREAALRLNMGFGAAEVVQGFIAFRDLAQELCAQIVPDDEGRLTLLRSLTEATDFTIVEFVTHFQQLSEEREAAHAQEMEALQRALIDQAVTDETTDLFTARFFDEHLALEVKRAARYGRAFSLVVLDVDEFEAHHGRYGPLAAAAALRATADALREQTRELDIKARTDETEFGLALPETLLEPAMVVADRVRTAVGETPSRVLDGGAALGGDLTVSVGVATFPQHGATARELHRAARRARDHARLLGGNMVIQADEAAGERPAASSG
ncbi:MAG: diguanylate cyclase [Armatimonadetes bacterium]|nr:diguanylate cyclase [Armatimonadota bacterium]